MHKLTDRREIQAFLETDRHYAAYALGDLEPGMFEDCTWAGAWRDGRLEALALHYRGLELAPLFLMGDTQGLQMILAGELRPQRAYLNCRPEHQAMTVGFYHWEHTEPMWRMVLRPAAFGGADGDCVHLTPADAGPLAELYALGGGMAFSPAQVARGAYFGLYAEGHLVAMAGTHLVSETYDVAAVGNVFTHPAHRGQGYGTKTTAAVVAELLERGINDVMLNVSQKNAPAIHIYERLGFVRYCPFLEGPVHVYPG